MKDSNPGRIMAIDIGDKWLGVALSDPLRLIASPLKTVRCETEEELLNAVRDLAKESGATLLVAGFPRSLDGSTGPQAVKVQRIIESIRSQTGLTTVCQDERYSTSRAKEILGQKKKHTKAGNVRDDAIAAALILEDYLNSHPAQ